MPALQFRQEPASLVKLRRTYRDRVAAHPDLASVLDRILENATSELAAAGIPFPPVRTEEEAPTPVSVVELSTDEWMSRRDVINLTIDRRYRWKKGGGYWGDCIPGESLKRRKLLWMVHLAVPPLVRWTRTSTLGGLCVRTRSSGSTPRVAKPWQTSHRQRTGLLATTTPTCRLRTCYTDTCIHTRP